MGALTKWCLMCMLASCDRPLSGDPEPPTAAPAAAEAAGPAASGSAEEALDCEGPGPPVPRCPPEPGTHCEMMWKRVEAWRAACGQGEASASGPEPSG